MATDFRSGRRWTGQAVLALAAFAVHLAAFGQAAAPAPQAYTWYDGEVARTVWLDPENVLEFTNPKSSPDEDGAALRRAHAAVSSAVQQPFEYAGVRLWHIGKDTPGGSVRAAARMATAGPNGRFSPVFRDNGKGAGRIRATTGNIEIFFKSPADLVAVRQWAQAKSLKIIKNLTPGNPAGAGYLIESTPGPTCIQLANSLRQDPRVEAAMPEWWQARHTR